VAIAWTELLSANSESSRLRIRPCNQSKKPHSKRIYQHEGTRSSDRYSKVLALAIALHLQSSSFAKILPQPMDQAIVLRSLMSIS
jgi:hypothetical protein